jgi:glycosyltransferase involved in cell wall biosynthesis
MTTVTAPRDRTRPASPPERTIAVTHVITTLGTGGAEAMLYRLLCAMDRSRFRNSVIALGGEGVFAERIRSAGIPVECLDVRPRQAAMAIVRLARALRRQQPQVVQTWMYHADLLGSLASLALRDVRVAWNIRCGGLDPAIDKRGTIRISRVNAALSRALPDRIVACSESGLATHAAAGYARAKMLFIPNGFDTGRYRPDHGRRRGLRKELGLAPGTPLVGAAGRFDRAKDHATLCRAAGIVCRAMPGVHFVMCGQGIDRQNAWLTGRLAAEGIANRSHLLGRREDIPEIMAALDVFVSSSAVEGFPNAIGEAMACGVPCVATDAGDSRALIGDAGLIAPVRDAQALARGVLQLIGAGPEVTRALGARARARICECFEIGAVARHYESLYQEMATRCAG